MDYFQRMVWLIYLNLNNILSNKSAGDELGHGPMIWARYKDTPEEWARPSYE